MNKKIQHYEAILKKSAEIDFLEPARETAKQYEGDPQIDYTLATVTSYVTAPVLLAYTAWVLFDAQKRGLRRLYFLSRDGFVLYEMALSLCKAWGIDIECRYFYCSRYILRLPLYQIDHDYAIDRIFDIGANTTAITVLLRAGISHENATRILTSIDWPSDVRLDVSSIEKLRTRLLNNPQFEDFASKAATNAAEQVRGYFTQECGDTLSMPFALVDSGWLGSMQESFCRVYNHIFDFTVNTDGYYFGMFAMGNPQFGQYHCWYFSPGDNYDRVRYFNNNLFECLCAANHGMTVGYTKKDGVWIPKYSLEADYDHAQHQLQVCDSYTGNFLKYNATCSAIPDFDKRAYALLKSLMAFPSLEEARFYGSIEFSDDATGTGLTVLAKPMSLREYAKYSFFRKIFEKILRVRNKRTIPLFWQDGSVALSKCKAIIKIDMVFYRAAKCLWMRMKMD